MLTSKRDCLDIFFKKQPSADFSHSLAAASRDSKHWSVFTLTGRLFALLINSLTSVIVRGRAPFFDRTAALWNSSNAWLYRLNMSSPSVRRKGQALYLSTRGSSCLSESHSVSDTASSRLFLSEVACWIDSLKELRCLSNAKWTIRRKRTEKQWVTSIECM